MGSEAFAPVWSECIYKPVLGDKKLFGNEITVIKRNAVSGGDINQASIIYRMTPIRENEQRNRFNV